MGVRGSTLALCVITDECHGWVLVAGVTIPRFASRYSG